MGKDYEAYHDKKKVHEYLAWFENRVKLAQETLRAGGALWVFINDGLVSEVDTMIKGLWGFHKRSHVIWYYTFGQNHAKNFTPSHTHVLYYVDTEEPFVWNPAPIRHPSARQVKYKDKRANPKGRLPDNTWAIFPELMPEGFDPAGDTWLASRVCGTFNEREKHSPNQIPVPIMERIILATTNPGDLVLDPMCGTGSTGVACKKHGRRFIGIDISKSCVDKSRRRISATKPEV